MLTHARPAPARGLTLVELMVTLAVLAFLMLAGLPSLSQWMRNGQIRTVAESLQNGMTKARNEAVRRNARVWFSMVTGSSSASCALSSSSGSWVVSLASPTGACNQANSDTTAPRILERWAQSEGSSDVTVAVFDATCATAATAQVIFDGFGRLTAPDSQARCIVVNHSSGSDNRALRITISPAGNVRMCDPAVTDTNDPRRC